MANPFNSVNTKHFYKYLFLFFSMDFFSYIIGFLKKSFYLQPKAFVTNTGPFIFLSSTAKLLMRDVCISCALPFRCPVPLNSLSLTCSFTMS